MEAGKGTSQTGRAVYAHASETHGIVMMAVSVTHWTIATFILRLEEEDSVIHGMLRGSWEPRDLLTYASPVCCGGPRIVFGWRGV